MPEYALLGHPLMMECHTFVTRHKPLSHRQWLDRMSAMPEIELAIDFYGNGPLITRLEQRMAELLGKERALFVHKGMVGQLSALKQWSTLKESGTIAIHPQSHLQIDESLAYQELCALQAVMFGQADCAITPADIAALRTDLAAVSVELPTRRAGFRLPQWSTLQRLTAHCKSADIPLHIDGARLFESSCYWQKSYSDVAALADSVYVSLYKTLGAAAGGIIAAEAEFIDSLDCWINRFGATLETVFPYVLTSLWGIDHYLPRIQEFHDRAASLSGRIRQVFGDQSIPLEVQCNGFLVELPVAAKRLRDRALDCAKNENIWMFDRLFEVGENRCRFEIQVGDALDDWTDSALIQKLERMIDG